jgi:hypothetical protein
MLSTKKSVRNSSISGNVAVILQVIVMGMTEMVDATQHGQEEGAILVIRSRQISHSELVGCQLCAFSLLSQRDKSKSARCCLAASFSN